MLRKAKTSASPIGLTYAGAPRKVLDHLARVAHAPDALLAFAAGLHVERVVVEELA